MTDPVVEQLRARLRDAPLAIARAAAGAERFASEHAPSLRGARRWALSGIGASEGVARAVAAWMRREARVDAEFLSFSRWLEATPHAPPFDAVVVWSQGLSPNARIAIGRAPAHATRVLITAEPEHPEVVRARAHGWLLCEHGPDAERGLLVRASGPACALAAGRALVDAMIVGLNGVHRAAREASAAFAAGLDRGAALVKTVDVASLDRARAIVCGAGCEELYAGLAWTWMELSLRAPVALWEPLAFAHGPFQALFDEPVTLLALERASSATDRFLLDQLQSMLVAPRHTLVRLTAERSGPEALFEHMGALWAVAIALLEARPRSLAAWPGRGLDGPLYDVHG